MSKMRKEEVEHDLVLNSVYILYNADVLAVDIGCHLNDFKVHSPCIILVRTAQDCVDPSTRS